MDQCTNNLEEKAGSQVALGKEKKKWSPEIAKMIGRSVVLGSKNNDSMGGTRDLFQTNVFLMYIKVFCLHICMYGHYRHVWYPGRLLDLLELELQRRMSYHVGLGA